MTPSVPGIPPLDTEQGLDRSGQRRGDAPFAARLLADPRSRFLVLVGDKLVIRSNPERTSASLRKFGIGELPKHLTEDASPLFLGVRPGTEEAIFALAISPENAETRARDGDLLAPAVDLRSLAMQGVLSGRDLSLAATAVALAGWHASARFCGRCGTPTAPRDLGWKRHCEGCGGETFPRTDPVVIMLVTAGDACVLARQSRFPDAMYSALAGYIEPGETIESAVARETAEEIGVAVDKISYFASQPWPFPHSLMIGCVAEARHQPLTPDPSEIEDARWFTRADVREMLEGAHPRGLWVPGPHAIAHWLARWFADVRT